MFGPVECQIYTLIRKQYGKSTVSDLVCFTMLSFCAMKIERGIYSYTKMKQV